MSITITTEQLSSFGATAADVDRLAQAHQILGGFFRSQRMQAASLGQPLAISPSSTGIAGMASGIASNFLSGAMDWAAQMGISSDANAPTNFVGVAIGGKQSNHANNGKPCVIVYVRSKLPLNQVPERLRVPAALPNNVLTDVVELPEPRFHNGFLVGGMQVVNSLTSKAGTLGCIATDGTNAYILSNNHVLAGNNTCPVGTPILRFTADGSGQTQPVAQLSGYVPLTIGYDGGNPVDAALAAISPGLQALGGVLLDSMRRQPLQQGLQTARIGMPVWKNGQRTGLTRGWISAVGGDFFAITDIGELIRMTDCVMVKGDGGMFSNFGDSGSLVLNDGAQATALLFGGSGNTSFCSHIDLVLSYLGQRMGKPISLVYAS